MNARERSREEKRHPAEWEVRLNNAEKYPEKLFSHLDESWQEFAKELAQGGLRLRIPPVLGIVMSHSARRDAIPAMLLDLRYTWASAREKLWQRVDSLYNCYTLGEGKQIRRELEEASKLFSLEQTEYDTQPMRVLWDLAAAFAETVVGAFGTAASSARNTAREVGPAIFGRGAFDLAKKVHHEVAMVDPRVLERFLSPSERKAFRIN